MTAPRIQTAADLKLKAFSNGFKAGMEGKVISENPFHTEEMRSQWLKGHREYEAKIKECKK